MLLTINKTVVFGYRLILYISLIMSNAAITNGAYFEELVEDTKDFPYKAHKAGFVAHMRAVFA